MKCSLQNLMCNLALATVRERKIIQDKVIRNEAVTTKRKTADKNVQWIGCQIQPSYWRTWLGQSKLSMKMNVLAISKG